MQSRIRAVARVARYASLVVMAAMACRGGADLLVTQPGLAWPDVVVSDYTIYRFDETTGDYLGVFGTASGYWGPLWNALIMPTFGPDGDVYVPNAHGNAVLRFAGSNGAYLGEFCRNLVGDANPYQVCFMPGGDLLMPSTTGLNRYAGGSGAPAGQFATGAGHLPSYAPDGTLLACRYEWRGDDWYTTFWRFAGQTGAPLGKYGPDVRGQIAYMLFRPTGELLVAEDPRPRVIEISGSSGEHVRDFVAEGAGGLVGSGSMAFGPDGDLYIADRLGRAIRRYSGLTGAPLGDLVPASAGTVVRPWGIAFTPRQAPVDTTPPTVEIVSPAATSYVVGSTVIADISVVDDFPGPITITASADNGQRVDTATVGPKVFTVSAVDAAGNASDLSVEYVVCFDVYALFDQTKAHKSGSTIPIKVRLVDASGSNVSSPSVQLQATGIIRLSDGAALPAEDSGQANPGGVFRFDTSLGGYILNLSLKGYTPDNYRLNFVTSGDPTTHTVLFSVR